MNTGDLTLNFNESVIFKLRSLFSKCGYSQYKMNKFEEYDLYAKNKDFLISDSIITFTDTNGKLLALKPDVTLSIIKNSKDDINYTQKVYYNENVYRISKGSQGFKEIMQVGLECIGKIDNYSISEVLTLACKSLKAISSECVLDISPLKIITDVFEALSIPSYSQHDILKYISEKNIHELSALCSELELSNENADVLKTFVTTSGTPDDVISSLNKQLKGVIDLNSIKELSDIIDALDEDIKNMIRIDFSVVSDTHYYNNIVFKGFINGVPTSVLTGGQYDKLLNKMKRKSGAIGFAVYLDVLDRLGNNDCNFDVDMVLVYSDNDDIKSINKAVSYYTEKGLSVFASSSIPKEIKYRDIIKLSDCEVDFNA
ncbi:MAG: ATP phosphoribosyltransferase regulatory subunit [Eubacteriales bacterium]|nr:ATP phosphoribosyltransferase regulatory subunit [Eubacteriales bacterium]